MPKLTEEQIRTLEKNRIKRETAISRIRVLGWSIEDAINKPVAPKKVKGYAFRVDEETNRAMVDFMEREGMTITDFVTKSIVSYLLAMNDNKINK